MPTVREIFEQKMDDIEECAPGTRINVPTPCTLNDMNDLHAALTNPNAPENLTISFGKKVKLTGELFKQLADIMLSGDAPTGLRLHFDGALIDPEVKTQLDQIKERLDVGIDMVNVKVVGAEKPTTPAPSGLFKHLSKKSTPTPTPDEKMEGEDVSPTRKGPGGSGGR